MTLEKPITLKSAVEKRDSNKKKKKLETEELLSKQEKKLLKQEKSQEVLERVEKKRRLKKSLDTQEEYHSENGSTIFTGPDNLPVELSTDFAEQPNIDDLSFEDIVVKPIKEHRKIKAAERNESMSTPDIDEKKKLLDMFGTDNFSEINDILNQAIEDGDATVTEEITPNLWDDFQATAFNQSREDKFDRYLKGRERTQQEQIDSHEAYKRKQRPWLSRIKNWFKKDSEATKDAVYEQHRNEIDHILDSNIESTTIEEAATEYQEALKHDQERYDTETEQWVAELQRKNFEATIPHTSAEQGPTPTRPKPARSQK